MELGWITLLYVDVFTNLEALRTLSVWIFMEDPLPRLMDICRLLIRSLAISDQTQPPALLPSPKAWEGTRK